MITKVRLRENSNCGKMAAFSHIILKFPGAFEWRFPIVGTSAHRSIQEDNEEVIKW